jgi:Ca2+-binding RTX toxin-like protein
VLLGEAGNDIIAGGFDAPNTLTGGDGNDRISASLGAVGTEVRSSTNFVTGDAGDDTISIASPQSDTISGGSGNDSILSTSTDPTKGDIIDGGDGNDSITVQDGLNLVRGGAGNDVLRGGSGFGSDTLDAGLGVDTLTGGSGADVFVLDAKTSELGINPPLCDRITDWEVVDHIKLRGPIGGPNGYAELTATDFFDGIGRAGQLLAGGTVEVVAVQVGSDVLVFADAGASNAVDTATFLIGRTLADISADNFL